MYITICREWEADVPEQLSSFITPVTIDVAWYEILVHRVTQLSTLYCAGGNFCNVSRVLNWGMCQLMRLIAMASGNKQVTKGKMLAKWVVIS